VATKLFFRALDSDYTTGNNDANLRGTATAIWIGRQLSTTAGSSATNAGTALTVAGATAGVEVGTSNPLVWYTPPIDADVTISGSITWNLWSAENSASANVAINGRIEKVDGATGAITVIDTTARTTEVALTTRAVNNFAKTPAAGVACKRGDRLRVRVFGDDAGTMATGFNFSFGIDGPTAAADGDSYFTLTETLSFAAEPAGSQVFPTATASAVSTASTDLEAWTSRGAGVTTGVTNTATGPTSGVQVTDTAGGTVVDWFTRPLTAFTLGGAVRVNARGSGVTASHATFRYEIAVVAGDGTGATVWAVGTHANADLLAPSEQTFRMLISGDDLAVTQGQRLRIRFYIDDQPSSSTGGLLVSGSTATLLYAGSAAATGDTYLTFTQALTEYVSPVTPPGPRVSPYPQILAH
jgi:hypothetical protein